MRRGCPPIEDLPRVLTARAVRGCPWWIDREAVRAAANVGYWRGTETFREERGIKRLTWLYQAVWREVVDELRRQGGRRASGRNLAGHIGHRGNILCRTGVWSDLHARQRNEIANRAAECVDLRSADARLLVLPLLDRLPDLHREVMADMARGVSDYETARRTGKSRAWIREVREEALTYLRGHLETPGGMICP